MLRVRAIVVNFQTPEETLSCVQSLLQSEGIECAVSIVDNSTTHTHRAENVFNDAAQHDRRIEVLEMEGNIGFAAANNAVLDNLDRYDEDYFALINPDSHIEAEALAIICTALRDHRVCLGGGLVLEEDGSVQPTCYRKIPDLASSAIHSLRLHRIFPALESYAINAAVATIPQHLCDAEAISGAFMLVHRKGVERVGALDTRYFMHVEDLDWCQRFALAGERILFVPQARLTHQKGIASAGRPLRVQWYLHRSMWIFYRSFQAQNHALLLQALVAGLISARFLVVGAFSLVKR